MASPHPFDVLIRPRSTFQQMEGPSGLAFTLLASAYGIEQSVGRLLRKSVADVTPPPLLDVLVRHVVFGTIEGIVLLAALGALLAWATRRAPQPLDLRRGCGIVAWASLPYLVPLLVFTILILLYSDTLLREGSVQAQESAGALWWLVILSNVASNVWHLVLVVLGTASSARVSAGRAFGFYVVAWMGLIGLIIAASATLVWRGDELLQAIAELAGKRLERHP